MRRSSDRSDLARAVGGPDRILYTEVLDSDNRFAFTKKSSMYAEFESEIVYQMTTDPKGVNALYTVDRYRSTGTVFFPGTRVLQREYDGSIVLDWVPNRREFDSGVGEFQIHSLGSTLPLSYSGGWQTRLFDKSKIACHSFGTVRSGGRIVCRGMFENGCLTEGEVYDLGLTGSTLKYSGRFEKLAGYVGLIEGCQYSPDGGLITHRTVTDWDQKEGTSYKERYQTVYQWNPEREDYDYYTATESNGGTISIGPKTPCGVGRKLTVTEIEADANRWVFEKGSIREPIEYS